jgi:hypothetical protein
MMPGSYMFAKCSPAFCDQIDPPQPPPSLPLTQIKAKIDVKTRLNWNEGPIPHIIQKISGYPCPIGQLVSLTARGPNGFATWITEGHLAASATWNNPVESIQVSGFYGGCYARPGTEIILATGVPMSWRRYTFSWAGGDASNVVPVVTNTQYEEPANCCGSSSNFFDFYSVAPGSNESRNLVPGIPSIYIDWIGAATEIVPGLVLYLRITGLSSAPWYLEVKGGALTIKNYSGSISRTFTGLLTDVVNQINSWPTSGGRYFDAVKPSNISSVATTGDLQPWVSPPIQVVGCAIQIPLVPVAGKLAPSCKGGISISGGGLDITRYSNTENGLIEYLTSPWYPKTGGSINSNNYYYPYSTWDSYVTAPYAGNTEADYAFWLKTSGSSTINETILSAPLQVTTTSFSLTATCERTFESQGCVNGSDYVYCDYYGVFPLDQLLRDCSGNIYPAGCNSPRTPCWCTHTDTSYSEIEPSSIPISQTLTGILQLQ